MSLLIVAAYYHYTKKRKLAPELVEEAGDPKVEEAGDPKVEEAGDPNLIIQSPDAKNDSEESKKSEQASYVWETDRFVVICEDEYESSNRNNEGMEVANSSQPYGSHSAR